MHIVFWTTKSSGALKTKIIDFFIQIEMLRK